MGHTRWATHGEPNKVNSHPHKVGDITLVHNGIIENYESLKKFELLSGYSFESETDTEVACALIDALYKKEKDMLKALKEAQKILVGSYAFGVLVNGDDRLYAMRKDSPLIVGIGNDENFIASDVPAIFSVYE
ncbi:MAG: class II glutamine amidotransferase [Clostridium sp.]|nr:MAG: class II glutamine amidotransferase [Clostridium sp.]